MPLLPRPSNDLLKKEKLDVFQREFSISQNNRHLANLNLMKKK